MARITIETNGEPTQVVVDGKQADFGPSAPSGGGGSGAPTAPNGDPPVGAISSMPGVSESLGTGYGPRAEPMMTAGVPVGLAFTVRSTGDGGRPVIGREIAWNGMPGGWWNRHSWAIFQSTGTMVKQAANELPAGTLGGKIEYAALKDLPDGEYVFALAVNGPGNGVPAKMGVTFNQQP